MSNSNNGIGLCSMFALIALAALGIAAQPSQAAVITPVAGSASGFQGIAEQFDAQPATTPTAGTTTDNFGLTRGYYTNDGRGTYFDFGEDWDQIVLTELWLGLKNFGDGPNGVAPVVFWGVNSNNVYEPGLGESISTEDFNIFTFVPATSDKSWQQIWSGNQALQGRYFIQSFNGTQSPGNRMHEHVFIGNVVPEPASLVLLAAGGVAMLGRRRPAAR